MRWTGWIHSLAAWATIAATVGCGARAQLRPSDETSGTGGSAGSGGVGAGGTGAGGLGGTGGSAGSASVFGHVDLSHAHQAGSAYPWERLALQASFYREDYDPERDRPDYVETRTTPDGVACDIYYQSGMIDEEPPPPPPQIDGGRIRAWAGWDSDDGLEITYQGDRYDVDSRPSSLLPMPGWLATDAMALTFRGLGSSAVGEFEEDAVLAAMPAITAPLPEQQPVLPGPDGTFRLAWQPTPADEIQVRLDFNLDWDNSTFICRPASDATELRLPAEWIYLWTWGSGELSIVARNEVTLTVADAAIAIRTSRRPSQAVSFEMQW